MEVLRLGYRIPFLSSPLLSPVPVPMPSYNPFSTRGVALEEVTLGLIAKGAVELAPLPSPGFYSRLFVVWKTSGSWRPVIDLSHLNRFCGHPARSPPLSVVSARPYSRGLLRQRHCGGVSPQGRRHQISIAEHHSSGDPALVEVSSHPSGSAVYPRLQQRPRGHSVSPSPAASFRVVPQYDRISVFKSSVAGANRFVCNLRQSPLLDLFFTLPRPSVGGHGRLPPVLGRSTAVVLKLFGIITPSSAVKDHHYPYPIPPDKNKNEKYELLGKEIESVQQEKDLGVVITKDLKSSSQCIEAVKKAQKLLGYIKRQFRTRNKETILTLYNALVRPHLEYAVQFWSLSLRKDIERLEAVQARATRHIPSIRHLGYVRRLERLNLYSLEKRRLRGQLIETFKMLKGVNNVDYRHLFTFSYNRTRSNGWKLELKRFNTSQCGNFFTYKIAPIWNRLPAEAVNSASVEQFKIELDKVIDTLI